MADTEKQVHADESNTTKTDEVVKEVDTTRSEEEKTENKEIIQEGKEEGTEESAPKQGKDTPDAGVYIPAAVRKLRESSPFLKMSNGEGQGIIEGEAAQGQTVDSNPVTVETKAAPSEATTEEDEDANIRLVPNAPHEGKRVYDTAFLLSFKAICKEKPEGLPELDITDPSKRKNQTGFSGAEGRGGRGYGGRGSGRGGRSRGGGGGKKMVPKQPAVPVPPPDENTWQPSRRASTPSSDNAKALGKKVKFILNKLTLEKFEPLSQELLGLVTSNVADVEGFTCVIKQVFDKALREPQFSKMYAELCLKLQKTCPTFEVEGKKWNFRRILLNECQNEFENKAQIEEKLEALSAEAKTEEELKLRNRVLNNIIFIGELFKLRMLTDKIMHGGVIRVLLNEKPTHLDLEAICKLFTTIGKLLEERHQAGGQQVMDQYFKRLKEIQHDEQFPSRIRFMIKDTIDLRSNRWQELSDDKPKTREQLKKAEKDKREAGRTGGTPQNPPRRVPSSGSIPGAARKEQAAPKNQGEWEVVGGKQGQRSGRRDNKPEGGRGKGGNGAGKDRKPQQPRRDGGRGMDNSRPGAKRAPQNSPQPGGRGRGQDRDSGNKKPAEPTTTLNPFELLGGDEMEDRKETKRGGGKSQELYVPSHRRQKDAPAPEKEVAPTVQKSNEEEHSKTDGEIAMLLEEYLCSHDEQEAAECLKELDAALRHHVVIVKGIEMSLEKKEMDREKIAALFSFLKSEGLLTELQASSGFEEVLEKVPMYDQDVAPNSSKYIGVFLGRAVLDQILPLQFLNKALIPLVSSGKALLIATEAISTIAQNSEPEEFQKLYQGANIDLLKFVKEENRNAEFLNKFMEGIKVRGSGLSSLLGS